MKNYIVIDIETLPDQRPGALDRIAENITPPANYSKPETIEKWEREDKPALIDKAYRATALDGATCSVVAFGRMFLKSMASAVICANEIDVLKVAAETLDRQLNPILVGHNVRWDIRVLRQRYVANRLPVPKAIQIASAAKPWDESPVCTMQMWTGDHTQRISLDNLCAALGIPGKPDGANGSIVWDLWKEGRDDAIERYCENDVRITAECFRIMRESQEVAQ